jgi:chemotaxis protein MotD
MIDASATAIGRGPIAVTGLKNSGSQDDSGAQDQGFGDLLEEASNGAAGGEISGDASGKGAAIDIADDKLSRSIISLFAVVQSGVKTTEQSGAAAQPQLPQSDQPASSKVDDKTALSLLGQAMDLDAASLAALLANADGATASEQLSAILAQLQQSGQIVPSDNADMPVLTEDDVTLDMMFANLEPTENQGAAHHLLAALTKALKEEGGDEAPVDEETAEAGAEASSDLLPTVTQNAAAQPVAKTIDITDTAPTRNADSAKDALAQISAQPHQDKSAHADLNLEDTVKAGKASDDLDFTGFDQLTVLDSRRYLGFGGDNAKMLTSALAGEAGRMLAPYATTTDLSAQATATTVNTLKIQMNPEHLGTMTAALRLKGDALSVEVTVDTIEGYRHLSKDHSAIVQSLRDQGFTVDQVSIQLNPAPKTESQLQDQGQNGSNQNLREGQGDAQRQQSGDGRSTPRSERLPIGDVQAADLDDGRGAGASGDGLYL